LNHIPIRNKILGVIVLKFIYLFNQLPPERLPARTRRSILDMHPIGRTGDASGNRLGHGCYFGCTRVSLGWVSVQDRHKDGQLERTDRDRVFRISTTVQKT
jgi:hypothetical protein